MAHVVLKAGSSAYLKFGKPTGAVNETGKGLVWKATDGDDTLRIKTVGGEIDPATGEPTGSITGYTVYSANGEALFTVSGLDVPVSLLLKGGTDAFYEAISAGDDLYEGGAGNDDLRTGTGADTLLGGAGDDTLLGGQGSDQIDGGDGRDAADFSDLGVGGEINLSTGLATFGDDVDTLVSIENAVGSRFADTIIGSVDDNLLAGGGGNDTLFGGGGSDELYGQGGDDLLFGGSESDVMVGGGGGDFLSGEKGHDVLAGSNGSDTLEGGSGADALKGGSGADVLRGGAGSDTLAGGGGRNGLEGGGGDDVFLFSTGRDFVATGSGADTLTATRDGAQVEVSDFELGVDHIALDVKSPGGTSIDELIQSGKLAISGDDGFTLVTFGKTTIRLDGVDVDDFSKDDLSLV